MIGLLTTVSRHTPVRAAIPASGVVTALAYVARKVRDGEPAEAALVEVGALDARHGDGEQRSWLRAVLLPGEEIEIVVTDVGEPGPSKPAVDDPLPPQPAPMTATGLEVRVNGALVARETIDPEPVVLALVTWSRGSGAEGGAARLDVGLDVGRDLAPGDRVLIRVLGPGPTSG